MVLGVQTCPTGHLKRNARGCIGAPVNVTRDGRRLVRGAGSITQLTNLVRTATTISPDSLVRTSTWYETNGSPRLRCILFYGMHTLGPLADPNLSSELLAYAVMLKDVVYPGLEAYVIP